MFLGVPARAYGFFKGILRRVHSSAWQAATEPETWVPFAGAAIIKYSGWDNEISEWAAEETPLFRSKENAGEWSDCLAAGGYAATLVTSVAATYSASSDKLSLIGTNFLAGTLTYASTNIIKKTSGRMRPDCSDYRSFPSMHTSMAVVNFSLSSRNLDLIPLSDNARTALRIGFTTLAFGTAWARVEAERHYLTDVLVGAALGNFCGSFISNLLIDSPKNNKNFSLSVNPFKKKIGIRFSKKF
jgi:hypothetical protein